MFHDNMDKIKIDRNVHWEDIDGNRNLWPRGKMKDKKIVNKQ